MHSPARSVMLRILICAVGVVQFLSTERSNAAVYYIDEIHFYDFSELKRNDFLPRGRTEWIVAKVGKEPSNSTAASQPVPYDWRSKVHKSIHRATSLLSNSFHQLQRNSLERLATKMEVIDKRILIIAVSSIPSPELASLQVVNNRLAGLPNVDRTHIAIRRWSVRTSENVPLQSAKTILSWVDIGESVAFCHSMKEENAGPNATRESAIPSNPSLRYLSLLNHSTHDLLQSSLQPGQRFRHISLTMPMIFNESKALDKLIAHCAAEEVTPQQFYSIVEFEGRSILVPQHIASNWNTASEKGDLEALAKCSPRYSVQRQLGNSLRFAGEWLISVSNSLTTSESRVADLTSEEKR